MVAELTLSAMQAQFGRDGARAWELANGRDDARIVPKPEEEEPEYEEPTVEGVEGVVEPVVPGQPKEIQLNAAELNRIETINKQIDKFRKIYKDLEDVEEDLGGRKKLSEVKRKEMKQEAVELREKLMEALEEMRLSKKMIDRVVKHVSDMIDLVNRAGPTKPPVTPTMPGASASKAAATSRST